MSGILIRWLIMTMALILASFLIPGIYIADFPSALVAAAILGILNAFIRPVLFLLTLPLTVLTLGLFALVLNGLMLQLVSTLVKGFYVSNFLSAILGSLIISAVSCVLNLRVKDRGRLEVIELRRERNGRWSR
ncbi:MAG: phage holin family protein [Deltaproteobacteria bacterium]|nr:phage holin family protein [Deltaproteobacteria bacterium]